MDARRLLGHEQCLADLSVRLAGGDEGQDFGLPWGEAELIDCGSPRELATTGGSTLSRVRRDTASMSANTGSDGRRVAS